MRKRILAYILAASMIITNGNMTVFAKEAAEEKIQQIEENTLAEERAEERLESETEIKESDSEKQTDTMSETEMSSETQSESSVTNMTDETQEEESVTNSGDEIQEEESVTGEVDEKEDEKTETKKQEETVLDNSIDEKSGQCGDNVYWTIDDEGKLTIYGTGIFLKFFSDAGIHLGNHAPLIFTVSNVYNPHLSYPAFATVSLIFRNAERIEKLTQSHIRISRIVIVKPDKVSQFVVVPIYLE